jgi:hypothetical protein
LSEEVFMSRNRWTSHLWAVAAVLTLAASTAYAGSPPPPQYRHDNRGGSQGHYDNRYGHNRYYPSRGYVVRDIPRSRYVVVDHYRHRYFYSGGIWYAPRGPRFVVVTPPIGLFVPVLPSFYSTVWVGGFPYYYANDVYYAWRPAVRQYEVVAPPDESSASTQPASTASSDIFVYPKSGQSEEQTAKDKYECHRWAASETGFDPTVAGGGVSASDNSSKRADYQRAMAACLEGRGYSVK